MKRPATRVLLLAAIAAAACSDDPAGVDCTLVDVNPYAIVVHVLVEDTVPRSVEEVVAVAVGPVGRHFLHPLNSGTFAAEIPNGSYDVTVQLDGFRTWTADDVHTVLGVCGGFDAVLLAARLEPVLAP